MGVTLSVRTALIIVGSIGVVFGIMAVLFGTLTFFICCYIRKNKKKMNPDKIKDSFNARASPEGDIQCDSAYNTSISSVPSSSTSTDNNISSHPPKPMKKSLVINQLTEQQDCCVDESMSTDSPYPARNTPDKPRKREVSNNQQTDTSGGGGNKRGKPVKRTNSCLQSIQPEGSSEPFTVLTVHKSTLKRQKASRSNSQKPLMEGEGRTSDDDEDGKEIGGKKKVEVQFSEANKKTKASPSSRRVFLVGKSPDYPKPSSKRPARTNSTKPLMLYEDEDMDEPTQEDFDNIQGVEEETLPSETSNIETTSPVSSRQITTPSAAVQSQAMTTPPPSSNRHNQAPTPSTSTHNSQTTTPSSSRRIQLPSLRSPSHSKGGTPPSSRRHSRRESLVLENLGTATSSNRPTHQGADPLIDLSDQATCTHINTSTQQRKDASLNISIEGPTLANTSTQGADTLTNMQGQGVGTTTDLFQASNPTTNSLVLKNLRTTTPTPTSTRRKQPHSAHHQMENLESVPQKSLNNLESDLLEIITKM